MKKKIRLAKKITVVHNSLVRILEHTKQHTAVYF